METKESQVVPTFHCPRCNAPHALFWVKGLAGKPFLKYHCNKWPVTRRDGKDFGETYLGSRDVVVGQKGSPETEPYEKLNIPERWTAKKIKKAQSRLQPAFPI